MNILIIDDIAEHADRLEDIILKEFSENYPDIFAETKIDKLYSGEEALREAASDACSYDYVFIDIKLAGEDGINIASRLEKILPEAGFIFCSSYDDYYLDVYDVEHMFFLHKPYDEDRVKKCLEAVIKREKNLEKEYFIYNTGHQKHRILLKNILAFENIKRKILIYTVQNPDGQDSFYENISDLEAKLPENFVRCHRGYIVNMDRARSMQPLSLNIEGKEIPVSRKYKDSVQEAFYNIVDRQMLRKK